MDCGKWVDFDMYRKLMSYAYKKEGLGLFPRLISKLIKTGMLRCHHLYRRWWNWIRCSNYYFKLFISAYCMAGVLKQPGKLLKGQRRHRQNPRIVLLPGMGVCVLLPKSQCGPPEGAGSPTEPSAGPPSLQMFKNHNQNTLPVSRSWDRVTAFAPPLDNNLSWFSNSLRFWKLLL